jgi:beta-N-acetylhexosaminidase
MTVKRELTLKEKIAQMLIVGIEGTTVESESRELVENVKVGGVILYQKNTPTAEETFSLTYDLQELALNHSLPLLVAIDEEHGRVHRIGEGTTHFVDMATVGRLNDTNIPKEIAGITARELTALGINMNFAPVCDVNAGGMGGAIGDRSFSSDPRIVAKMVSAYIKEGRKNSMILCAKHFPGHGDTEVDSHLDLPVLNKNLNELMECELIPFEAAIKARVPTIMTAHILFPKIDDKPATMSRKIINDILIKKLWFTGVIISDDMCMGAIAKNYGMLEAFTLSINAGVNMFIVSNMLKHEISVENLVDSIEEVVKKGDIDEKLIDISVEKILKLKKKYVNEPKKKKILRKKSLRQETSLKFAKYLEEKKSGLDS